MSTDASITVKGHRLTHPFPTTVIAKGTSVGWLPSESEGIPKAAKRFRKQAGGVPLQ
jgi:hypothetical protein